MPRIYIPGISAHVFHRGNNCMDIFRDDSDREVFLTILQGAAARKDVDVHAFVLMTTHFHMIATPNCDHALPRAMKELGQQYVRFFNRKYDRSGTIWEGRYDSLLIMDDLYWLTCLRYVEQNPVRAGMVPTPDAYRWSSYGVHGLGHASSWLVQHPVYLALGPSPEVRQAAYRAICAEQLSEAQLVCVRNNWILPPQPEVIDATV